MERDLRRFYVGRRVMLNLGSATDPYQPVEAERGFMRRLLPLLEAYGASIYVCTKSTLVLRDLDLLAPYQHRWVGVTITSLGDSFSLVFEPRAPKPSERLKVVEELSTEGVPVVVRVDPIIPFINDDPEGLAHLVDEVASAGAKLIVASTLKLDRSGWIMDGSPSKPSWKRALSEALRTWGGEEAVDRVKGVYELGEVLHGYLVPSLKYRFEAMKVVKEACEGRVGFAPCKMGMEVRQELTTWRVDGEFGCACYMYRPAKIKKPRP